jgi:radical SAM superfamily enzyme YgiQ (UPF0313 family)
MFCNSADATIADLHALPINDSKAIIKPMTFDDVSIKDLNEYRFEQGPIRPPSEAYSLLLRVTRNCPWNRCLFCTVYKGTKFELREADEVIEDIKKVKTIYEEIKKIAWKIGKGDSIKDVAANVYNQYNYDWSVRNVGLWMWAGAKSVFLQDANTLIMRTPDLVKVLLFLKESFPQVNRITSYARSKTAAKKTVEELIQLKDAGLSRLHIGLESGSDEVLKFVDKGVTAAEQIEGGKNVKKSGISLSEYIMPGLGGKKWSDVNALETARVLNEIDPDFIRLRTLGLGPVHPLWAKVQSGEYEPPTDDEIAAEIGKMIEKLEVTSYLASDHMSNLLPEVEGKFPEAKQACLDVINRYLALPEKDRLNYKVGRRMGYYEKLDDIKDKSIYSRVEEIIDSIELSGVKSIEDVLSNVRAGMTSPTSDVI